MTYLHSLRSHECKNTGMRTNDAYCTFMNIYDSVTKHGSAVTLCAEPPSRLVAKGLERLESRSLLSHYRHMGQYRGHYRHRGAIQGPRCVRQFTFWALGPLRKLFLQSSNVSLEWMKFNILVHSTRIQLVSPLWFANRIVLVLSSSSSNKNTSVLDELAIISDKNLTCLCNMFDQ